MGSIDSLQLDHRRRLLLFLSVCLLAVKQVSTLVPGQEEGGGRLERTVEQPAEMPQKVLVKRKSALFGS